MGKSGIFAYVNFEKDLLVFLKNFYKIINIFWNWFVF